MPEQRFRIWDDCPECRGTGAFPDAETECDYCRSTYVAELEQMVSDCVSLSDVMREGYSEKTLLFVCQRVGTYRAGSDGE